MEVEAILRCEKCKSTPMTLYREQVAPGSDVFINRLRTTRDKKPMDKAECPKCKGPLVRE